MTYPVWKWAPNWAAGLRERVAWKTNVHTYRGGREDRHRMGTATRTTIGFEAMVDNDKYKEMSMMLQAHQADHWLMPVWWDVTHLLAPAGPGSTWLPIPLNPFDRDYRVGGWAVLEDTTTGEMAAVEIAKPFTVWTVAAGFDRAWPVETTRVYPARIVQLSQVQKLAHVTAKVTTLSVDCRVVDNANHAAAVDASHLETLEPNRRRDVNGGFETMVGEADFGVGPFTLTDFAGRSFRTTTYDYACTDRGELGDIRGALAYLSGRLGELRLPTFQSDFYGDGDAFVFTGDGEFFAGPIDALLSMWGKVDGYLLKHLKSPLITRFAIINDAYASGGKAFLESTIEGSDIPVFLKDCKFSFVYNSRLASDTVEINHITPEVSEVSIGYRSIK